MKAIAERLDACNGLSDVFEIVKASVRKQLGLSRAGLMLGLMDMGMVNGRFVGAFYILGSNIIVVNKAPLERLTSIKPFNREAISAYAFHVLLHEYLHSLGYVREGEVGNLTYEISKNVLGEDHLATRMALHGVSAFFPNATYPHSVFQLQKFGEIELVKDFDRSSTTYIT